MEKLNTRELNRKNNWMGFLALLKNWSIIITMIWLSVNIKNLFFYLFAIIIISFFQFAIGEALIHEACHNHLFKSQWLNENLSFLYAEPFFYTLLIYRDSHFPHHTYFRSQKDPSHGLYRDLGLGEKTSSFWIQFLKICLGRASFVHVNYFIYSYSIRSPLRIILFWLPTLFISYTLGVIKILLLYWLIPYLFIFPVILYWNITVNHYRTKTGTRTVINPISNWIAHNNGYHHIHHLFPSIPWYKLPKVYQQLYPEGAEMTHNFFESFQQLQSIPKVVALEYDHKDALYN